LLAAPLPVATGELVPKLLALVETDGDRELVERSSHPLAGPTIRLAARRSARRPTASDETTAGTADRPAEAASCQRWHRAQPVRAAAGRQPAAGRGRSNNCPLGPRRADPDRGRYRCRCPHRRDGR